MTQGSPILIFGAVRRRSVALTYDDGAGSRQGFDAFFSVSNDMMEPTREEGLQSCAIDRGGHA
jgi:hypothetical protein